VDKDYLLRFVKPLENCPLKGEIGSENMMKINVFDLTKMEPFMVSILLKKDCMKGIVHDPKQIDGSWIIYEAKGSDSVTPEQQEEGIAFVLKKGGIRAKTNIPVPRHIEPMPVV
jgi:hypothetical protein